MKSKDLKVLSITELRKLAKQLKVSLKRTMTKQMLVKAIVASARSRSISATLKGKKKSKAGILRPKVHAPLRHDAVKLHDEEVLPVYHGITKLVLMPRDPWWVFVYWEIDRSLVSGKTLILRVYRQHNRLYASINVGNTSNWYINLPEPADTVRSELGYLRPNGAFNIIAVSNTVRTPRAWPSDIGYGDIGNNPMGPHSNLFTDSYPAYERSTPYSRENITSRKR
jgi:hypothetical protein